MKVRTDLKAGSDFELEAEDFEEGALDLGEMGEESGMFLLPPSDPSPVR